MDVEPKIQFHHITGQERHELNEIVTKRASGLSRFLSPIHSCRVVVERPENRPEEHGDRYRFRVSIEVNTHGEPIVATKSEVDIDQHQGIDVGVRRAFDAVEKQLRQRATKIKKTRGKPADEIWIAHVGSILEVDYTERQGFIESDDGRRIYFHENAVQDTELIGLQPGDKVRFEDTEDTPHPRATMVRPLDTNERAATGA